MREIRVYADLDSVAQQAANALVEKTISLSNSRKSFNIVLTGGSVGIKTLEKVSTDPRISIVSLDGLNLWWGDERFLPKQDLDRNALQAKQALLDSLKLRADQIHEFPAADTGLDLDQAAAEFSSHYEILSPSFDLVLLGVGPDGHVASLFPDRDALHEDQLVIAEYDSPKPPAQRLSFSYTVLNSAEEVWFLAAGIEKSAAVAEVLSENSLSNLPAAKVSGLEKTIWFLDEAAASLRK
jgi:6-phosphogluconolactonase